MISNDFEIARTILLTISACISILTGTLVLFAFRASKINLAAIKTSTKKSFFSRRKEEVLSYSYDQVLEKGLDFIEELRVSLIKIDEGKKFYWFPWTLGEASKLKKSIELIQAEFQKGLKEFYIYRNKLEEEESFIKTQKLLKERNLNKNKSDNYPLAHLKYEDVREKFSNQVSFLIKFTKEEVEKLSKLSIKS